MASRSKGGQFGLGLVTNLLLNVLLVVVGYGVLELTGKNAYDEALFQLLGGLGLLQAIHVVPVSVLAFRQDRKWYAIGVLVAATLIGVLNVVGWVLLLSYASGMGL